MDVRARIEDIYLQICFASFIYVLCYIAFLSTFSLLFFRYPNYTPILLHAVELWHHEPQVTTPVLKLFAELVQNRSQRLQFDASSPNGILLFREASKIICSYGNHILNVEVPKDQIYPLKLKGISICFSMLKAALCGSYVNFGVFRLYGDEALDNALNTFVKLLLSIPQSDLLVSIKILSVRLNLLFISIEIRTIRRKDFTEVFIY